MPSSHYVYLDYTYIPNSLHLFMVAVAWIEGPDCLPEPTQSDLLMVTVASWTEGLNASQELLSLTWLR